MSSLGVTATAPVELVLDIDASDVPLHGAQELSQFHAYYDQHCYLPLYVFCGQAMLACYLRPSRIDGARHAAAVIKLIVTRLRQAWPNTRFIVRADSGFCRRRLLRWCERSGVGYIVGLARNARLHAVVQVAEASLADAYTASGSKQRLIGEFSDAAKSWSHERRVITRLEYGEQGTNPRFVVTNLQGDPEALYDTLHCQRGDPAQHAPRTGDVGQPPPLARAVRRGGCATGRAQPIATHPVPGPHVDTNKARSPSRGRGTCAPRPAPRLSRAAMHRLHHQNRPNDTATCSTRPIQQ